jgi:iron complex transport system permease protein
MNARAAGDPLTRPADSRLVRDAMSWSCAMPDGSKSQRTAGALGWLALLCCVVVAAFVTSGLGQVRLSYETIARLWISLLDREAAAGIDETLRYIAIHVRLARICLALVVGGALATAGAVYQGVLLNPLADPFTLGVSTGAAFAAALGILLGWGGIHAMGVSALPLLAFLGAIAALYLVYVLGRWDGRVHPTTLVLAGIIVSTFLSAWISLMKSLHEESLAAIVFWVMGSLSGRGWLHVLLVTPYLLVGGVVVWAYGRELDLLCLGDVQAQQLGVDVPRVRLVLLITASLMTAAAVSVSGVIGFVGLVVPHLVRMTLGPKHRRLLPVTLVVGGLLVLLADTLARSVLPRGAEMPVGVVTAILGGPFFCLLLLQRKKYLLQ